MTRFASLATCLALLGFSVSNTPSTVTAVQQPVTPRATNGHSTTLLPDGTRLVAGGFVAGRPVGDVFIVDAAGKATPIAQRLLWPRAGHSATVLADGRILIVGGVDRRGRVETHVEIISLAQRGVGQVESSIQPRSGHTATLLTDGRVLIAGGRDDAGTTLDSAQIWNVSDGTVTELPLLSRRAGHRAVLQGDGTVLLTGGGVGAEVYVPGAEVIVPAGAESPSIPVILAGSLPEDRATDVPTNTRIALRFSGALAPGSVGSHSLRLSAAGGDIPTSVSFAEGGRLVFLAPLAALDPGQTYVLVAHGLWATDASPLSTVSLSFTTTGASPSSARVDRRQGEVWTPGGPGRWRSGGGRSPWQDLPPLSAPAGTTALAGQVLALTGRPIADVELEIDGHTTRSDRTGRFLLRLDGVPTGRHVLEMDGAPASNPGRRYGFFEAGVQVVAGETTALPFTIWMPVIDIAHAVTIPSPTTQETIVTTPHIPGLELRLPAGTSIRDEDGRRVTQVSITPIPVDRPPFPLPAGVEVPIYFTIQPGGAYVATYGDSSKKARLHYPNYTAQAVGTRMDFWHYEPEGRGWYIYGEGEVVPPGRQVVPDPGVGIYEFTGAMISTGGTPPPTWPNGGLPGGDPVDLASGLFVLQKTDLLLRDVVPIALTRTYRPGDSATRAFGIGSTHAYDLRLWRPSLANYDDVALILPDGKRLEYERIDGGTGFVDMVLTHTTSPTAFYGSVITWNGNGFDLAMKDGTVLVFGDSAPLQAIRDSR